MVRAEFFQLGFGGVSGAGSGFIFTPALCPLSLLRGHFHGCLVKGDVMINRERLKRCPKKRKRGRNTAGLRCRRNVMMGSSAGPLPSHAAGISNLKQ